MCVKRELSLAADPLRTRYQLRWPVEQSVPHGAAGVAGRPWRIKREGEIRLVWSWVACLDAWVGGVSFTHGSADTGNTGCSASSTAAVFGHNTSAESSDKASEWFAVCSCERSSSGFCAMIRRSGSDPPFREIDHVFAYINLSAKRSTVL